MNLNQIIADILQPMNLGFLIAIIAVALISIFFKRDKNLVTMVGILGTFIGIVLALTGLDTKNITESIPNLLNGLKTAFWTSIFGAVFAILLTLFARKEDTQEEVDFLKEISESQKNLEKNLEKFLIGQDEFSKNFLENQEKFTDKIFESNEKILGELQVISQNASKNGEIIDELKNLSKNMVGEGDSSLATQMKNMRMDIIDTIKDFKRSTEMKQDELIKEFQVFAEKIGDASMEKMIEAVQRVMDDFDKKINDQLGQSFQDLKNAIDNLLLWQGEYRENIIKQTEGLEHSNKNLQISVESIGDITEKSQKFAEISEKFGSGLDNLDASLGILKSGLSEFDKVAENQQIASEKMIESIDSLKNNFVSSAEIIVEESEKHIKNMTETLQHQTENLETTQKGMLKSMTENMESHFEDSKRHYKELNEKLSENIDEVQKSMKTSAEKFSEKMELSVDELQSSHKNILENIKNTSENEMKNYSKFLSENLEKQSSDLQNSHKNILENLEKNIESQTEKSKQEFTRIHSDLADLVGESVKESNKIVANLKTEVNDFNTKLQEIFEVNVRKMQDSYEDMLKNANAEISQNSQSVVRMRQALENDFKEFDRVMGEELNKSLTTLGQQLTALSAKFVSDYTNLATKLERIAQMANK